MNKLLKQLEAYVKCSVDHFSVDEAQPLPPAIPFRPVVRSVGSMAQQSTCLKIYSALLSSPGRLQLPASQLPSPSSLSLPLSLMAAMHSAAVAAGC